MIVYLITNLVTGKQYVGQTTGTLRRRWFQHNQPCRGKTLLGKSLSKYGIRNFKIKILETCKSLEDLNARERYWIAELNTQVPLGYNLLPGGNSLGTLPKSESHKRHISEKLRGKPKTLAHRRRLSEIRKGICWRKNEKPVVGSPVDKTKAPIGLKSAASGRVLGFNPAHIRGCCLGHRKTHRGYTWRYA